MPAALRVHLKIVRPARVVVLRIRPRAAELVHAVVIEGHRSVARIDVDLEISAIAEAGTIIAPLHLPAVADSEGLC